MNGVLAFGKVNLMDDLWTKTLETLGHRFGAASDSFPAIQCMLIHRTRDDAVPAYPKYIREFEEAEDAQPPFWTTYGDFRLYKINADRIHILRGTPESIDKLNLLARHAGMALSSPPSAVAQVLPKQTIDAFYDVSRWIWTVFDLCSQSADPTPLRAPRWFWWGDQILPYDSDPEIWSRPWDGTSPKQRARWAKQLPGYYFSELSNLLLASVHAVNKILDICDRSESPVRAGDDDDEVDVRTASGSVVLRGPHSRPMVNGHEKKVLTQTRYDLVKKIILTGEDGMTKDEMERHYSGARRILKSVREQDKDWADVIKMAGKTGGGYRII